MGEVAKQRWSRHMAEPTLMNQTCPRIVAMEKAKEPAFDAAVSACRSRKSEVVARSRSQPGRYSADERYSTTGSTYGELHSPELALPTFPVAKFQYHAEALPRAHMEGARQPPGHTKLIPEDFLPRAHDIPPADKYRYFSEQGLADSVYF